MEHIGKKDQASSGFQQGKFNPIEFVREKRAEREAAKAALERAKLNAYNKGADSRVVIQ